MPSTGITLAAKWLDLDLGRYQVVLNHDDAEELGIHPQDRVQVSANGHSVVCIVDTTATVVQAGEAGIFPDVARALEVDGDADVHLRPAERPKSVEYIRRKMDGGRLEPVEIQTLVEDMVRGALSDVELASFVTSVQIHDMDIEETAALTRSMVKTGEVIEFEDQLVFDKHSIGGVPGNKITLLVVPIVAAAGLKIPKTSSRAITGAAGTSDVVELFCNVHLSADEIRDMTNQAGGVMAWGGAVNLAPADDIIIRVEHPLSLDPRSLLLASVMAKKAAVSADHLVIDIPMGEGAKIATMDEAKVLARDFIALGERLGMEVECAITYGGQPVGKTVGPALEANEALRALKNEGAPESFVKKSTAVAGILLEMGGLARRGKGQALAQEILDDGRAYDAFCDIVQAQGGPEPHEHPVGEHTWDLMAPRSGYVSRVDNRALVQLCRALGAPRVKGAGVVLPKKRGDKVDEGESILTLHAESEYQLQHARKLASNLTPVEVEGMLLERVPDWREVGATRVEPPAG